MDEVAAIEATMAEARRARSSGDVRRAEELLAHAHHVSTTLDPDHSIRSVVGWRHLKALFDLGRLEDLEAQLERILELEEPFGQGSGLRAAEPIARGIWDRLGYGRPTVRRLWERYVAHFEAAGDPWMAACGRSQLLWDEACSGELHQVLAAVDTIACTTPEAFAGGASRHPRAADAASSLFYAQIEQARIASWASVWGRDEALARVALELYADALAEAEEPEDYWFVEASARSEARFGWTPDALERWAAAAASLDHPRAELHRALAGAELLPGSPLDELAGRVGDADEAGPEWGVDVRHVLLAAGCSDPRAGRWREEADDRIRRFRLGVFEPSAASAATDRTVR